MGRAFLFLYLLTQFTISLHQMVKLDLSEFFLIFFLIAFFLRALNTNEKIITTKLDAFNLLFAISILFATTNTTVFVFVLSSITLIKFLIIPFLVVNLVYKENLLEFAALYQQFLRLYRNLYFLRPAHFCLSFRINIGSNFYSNIPLLAPF